MRDAATDEVVVSALVALLAERFGGVAPHQRQPASCPMFVGASRSRRVEPRKFDAACRRALTTAIPGKLPALVALLRAFATRAGSGAAVSRA